MTSWSDRLGRTRIDGDFKAALALTKKLFRLSVQDIFCSPVKPFIASSKGASKEVHLGIALEMSLYAPKNDLIAVHVSGGELLRRGHIL